jgi:photosystem II stability/assembly factor-like uncharacterized protein
VLSMDVSPNFATDSTLYAGTESQGLWQSTDGGETWQQLGADLLVDPVNTVQIAADQVLVVTSADLWQSADGGAAWQSRLPESFAGREISALLALDGAAPGARLLAGFVDGSIEAVQL